LALRGAGPQLHQLLRSKGIDFSAAKSRAHLQALARYALMKPGVVCVSGHQEPGAKEERNGRRHNCYALELDPAALDEPPSPLHAAAAAAKSPPGRASPRRPAADSSPSSPSSPLAPRAAPGGVSPPGRASPAGAPPPPPRPRAAEVLAAGANVHGYLGLGLDSQPSHPSGALGPARSGPPRAPAAPHSPTRRSKRPFPGARV
jgi:hypothetical protein